MIDVWLGDLLVVLTVPAYMLSVIQRLRPRLASGDGIQLIDPATLQAEYKQRYPRRLFLLRILPVVLALYFGIRIATWPIDQKAEGPRIVEVLIAVFALWVASIVGTSILRIRQEQSFVKAHPEFADSFLPVRPRVMAIVPLVLAFGIIVVAIALDDGPVKVALLVVGMGVLIIGRIRQTRQLTRSKHELPWGEPLGNRIAEVIEQFGKQPKKLVLLPSLIPNAAALPDGSVVVTSALRTLLTSSEVAAVVAHELSHVRDGEGKKLTRLRMILFMPIGGLAGLGVAVGSTMPFEAFLPPFIGFGAMTLATASIWIYCRRSQVAEFKCDADAAKLALGDELASALDKLMRFIGAPNRWIGIDRYLLTHPSTDERVARLRQSR